MSEASNHHPANYRFLTTGAGKRLTADTLSLADVSAQLFSHRMALAVVTESARRFHEVGLSDTERAYRFAIHEDARDDAADANIAPAKIDTAAHLGTCLAAVTVAAARRRDRGMDWDLISRSMQVREIIRAAYEAGALPGQVDDALVAADRSRKVSA